MNAPRRQRHHPDPLDEPHQEAEGARPRADHDRRAERDGLGRGIEQQLFDGQPACEMCGRAPALRHRPAQVHDAPHASAPRGSREVPRPEPLALGEGRRAVDGRLHRMDEVIGDIRPGNRGSKAFARDHIAAHDLLEAHCRHPRRSPRERANGVAARHQPRYEVTPDRAACSGHEHPHRR